MSEPAIRVERLSKVLVGLRAVHGTSTLVHWRTGNGGECA
jgi:hypothetical protein